MSADAESFVVISHVNPQSCHINGPEGGLNSKNPNPEPKPLSNFYKGEPEVLGHLLQGIVIALLLLSFLLFTINISTSVFACKTISRSSFNEMTVVIYQTTTSNVPVTAAASTTEQPTEKE